MDSERPQKCRPDGFPRRGDYLLMTAEEKQLADLQRHIDSFPAHETLTATVILIGQAREKLADYVERTR